MLITIARQASSMFAWSCKRSIRYAYTTLVWINTTQRSLTYFMMFFSAQVLE